MTNERRMRDIVRRDYDFLWCALRRFGLDPSNVDDAAQRVLVVLSRRLTDVQAGEERGFLFGTAARVASEARRTARRRREIDSVALGVLHDPTPDPEERLAEREAVARVDAVLASLPAELRAVVRLVDLEEVTMRWPQSGSPSRRAPSRHACVARTPSSLRASHATRTVRERNNSAARCRRSVSFPSKELTMSMKIAVAGSIAATLTLGVLELRGPAAEPATQAIARVESPPPVAILPLAVPPPEVAPTPATTSVGTPPQLGDAPKQCSAYSSEREVIEVTNATSGNLDFSWVDRDCKEQPMGTFAPGTSFGQLTFAGHVFRARERATGRLLKEWTVGKALWSLTDSRPIADRTPTECAKGGYPLDVALENQLPFRVDLTWIDDACKEVPEGSVNPGELWAQHTSIGHTFRVRRADTHELLQELTSAPTRSSVP